MKKISFKKIFSHMKRGGSIEKKPLYEPHRDWTVITATFFVVLVVTIILHLGMYVLANRRVIFYNDAQEEVFQAALKRELIEKVVTEFENKKLNTASFNGGDALQDPS